MPPKTPTDPRLTTWISLNKALLVASVDDCKKLLALERRGRNRLHFLLRIHSRYNKLRAADERMALANNARV